MKFGEGGYGHNFTEGSTRFVPSQCATCENRTGLDYCVEYGAVPSKYLFGQEKCEKRIAAALETLTERIRAHEGSD